MDQNNKPENEVKEPEKKEETEKPSEQKELPEPKAAKETPTNEADKLDLILKKLEETENKVKELEKKNAEEEQVLKQEEVSVQKIAENVQPNFFSKNSKFIIIGIIVIAAVLIVLFALKLPPFSSAGVTSAQFFSPSDGNLLASSYISGLSNLSAQLAVVGATQVNASLSNSFVSSVESQGLSRVGNTSVFCLPASAGTSGQGHPAYCILFMSGGNNYDVIPIATNSSFPTLTSGGKPTFLYIGAAGCPFCAQIRWAFVVALDRFGTFTKLFSDRSATVDWNVPTIMFNFSKSIFDSVTSEPPVGGAPYGDSHPTPFVEGAYYTSQYINFEPFDQMGGSFFTNTTGLTPFLSSNFTTPALSGFNIVGMPIFPQYGVPFFDINNKFVFDGSIVNAGTILDSSIETTFPQYSTHADILNSIQNPTTGSFGESVLGAANILTAQICEVINNAAPVCSLSYIKTLESLVNNS